MSQHDMIIDNAAGASVRADINLALAALATNSSGTAEPGTKYPFMLWADTSNNMLKLRNASNTAWINLLNLSTGLSSLLDVGSILGGIAAGSTATGSKNKIINGNFGINQRAYVSGAAVGAGLYGHDRWKMAASGDTYEFSTTQNVTTVTIPAGKVLRQVIEGVNLQSGTYTLSWAGSAKGKIGAGALSSSGVTGSVVGGTDLTIEFGPGTVSKVHLEEGSVATSFDNRPYGLELTLCQRYYSTFYLSLDWTANLYAGQYVTYSTTMRSAPTFAVIGSVSSLNVSGVTFNSIGSTNEGCDIYGTSTNTTTRCFYKARYSATAEL